MIKKTLLILIFGLTLIFLTSCTQSINPLEINQESTVNGSLDTLEDVNITNPLTDESIVYNGSIWTNQLITSSAGSIGNLQSVTDNGATTINDLETGNIDVNGNMKSIGNNFEAEYGVLQDRADFGRAGFKLISKGNAKNFGLSIRNSQATGNEKDIFLEVVNAEDYSPTTNRLFLSNNGDFASISTGKGNGADEGSPIYFTNRGFSGDKILWLEPGRVGINEVDNPQEALHVNGNVYIEDGSLIMESPDNTKWRLTINNTGSINTEQI